MSGDLGTSTVTKVIGYMTYLHIIVTYAFAKNITLDDPKSTFLAQIGEELRITCLGTKCGDRPKFTWSSLTDAPLSGTIENYAQISVLTMKIVKENLELYEPYRCTVSCVNPPAERGFKVIVYSFPKPILTISSRVAGEQSRINCTIPDAYPHHMINAQLRIGEKVVASYDPVVDDVAIKNISLSHNLILTDDYEAQEIRCEAELQFETDEFDPIHHNSAMHLNLQYPPENVAIKVSPDKNVRATENIHLSCSFESKSPANFQWMKLNKENGQEKLSGRDLTIENVQPSDSGIYICRVWNHVGQKTAQVQITVEGPPEKPTLTIHPTTTVQAGKPVTIECSVNGNQNVNVTLWKVLRDGDTPLVEAKGKLVIKEADPIDTAVYKCTAENYYGISEALQSLTVQYPPMETVLTVSDQEVNEGDEVTLTCSSKGVPEPNFLLYQLLPSGERILLSEGPVVTLTNVTSGVYQCSAFNSLGNNKEKLELKVRYPPRSTYLSITPSLVSRVGESLHIRCTSESYPAPTLVMKKKTETGLVKLDAENGLYSISTVREEHAGEYICESSNMVGHQEAMATLTVQVPPKNTHIIITPSEEVREGDWINIECISEASPAPKLTLKVRTEYGERELELVGGHYRIAHASVEHSGTYICESTNVAGQQQEETTLTIPVSPNNTHIIITPSGGVREGDSIDIRCISEASPDPKLTLKVRTEYGERELELVGGHYQIAHASVEHSGTYICESTNIAGQQQEEITLTIQVPPTNTHIIITPSEVVREGDLIDIRCISEAYPVPKLTLKVRTEYGERDLELEGGHYQIAHASVEHSGTFICESTNVAGQEQDETILTVQAPPKNTFISFTPSSLVKEGDNVQIQCTSEAYPSPGLVLQLKTDQGDISQLESEDGLYNITDAGEKNTGTYICVSTNKAGQQTAEATLSVQIPPRNPTVVTPPQNITADVTVPITYIIPPPEPQKSPGFDYVPPAIIGSVVLVTAGFIGYIAYNLKQARAKGSYSLVNALRGKV